MSKLKKYQAELLKAQEEQTRNEGTPWIGRVENPAGVCDTLWIPVYSGNRTAVINLNHTLNGFDQNGVLWGENGNCGMSYVIIELPKGFNQEKLDKLCECLCKKLGKGPDYPKDRVLKADDRLPLIIESINAC